MKEGKGGEGGGERIRGECILERRYLPVDQGH